MSAKASAVTEQPAINAMRSVRGALRIQDVIDLNVLQRIQDTFAKAMGVGAVTVDRDGNEVTHPSNFQPICLLIRSTEAGLARCRSCDDGGGRNACNSGRPSAYMCKSGLMDVAAPIIIEDEYLGCILCGQVMLDSDVGGTKERVTERSRALGLPDHKIRLALQNTNGIARERLDAAAEMLMLTANHIIEIGMANLVQDRLLQESAAKAEVENALRDAKLRAMQAQINPHFLFNSLTLVSCTAQEESAPRTEEITYMLSDLLRYSLRNISATVTLGEEFKMIDHYLSLQQIRFGERFKKSVAVEAGLEDVPVPCMVLLPLVENAIVHGVESVVRPVSVIVGARRDNGQIRIEVRDNGVGMSAERVQSLNEHRQVPASNSKRPSLGLQSVIRRLEDEHGVQLGFSVASAPGKGTRILLRWPINELYQDEWPDPQWPETNLSSTHA